MCKPIYIYIVFLVFCVIVNVLVLGVPVCFLLFSLFSSHLGQKSGSSLYQRIYSDESENEEESKDREVLFCCFVVVVFCFCCFVVVLFCCCCCCCCYVCGESLVC